MIVTYSKKSIPLLLIGLCCVIQAYAKDKVLPASITEGVHMKYLKDDAVVAILETERLDDYTNLSFPYKEFPLGLHLTRFSDSVQQTIEADYGIIFSETNVIYLKGNVIITTPDRVITSETLFLVNSLDHIYSEDLVNLKSEKEVVSGRGLDSDKNFINLTINEIKGIIKVDKESL